MFWKSVKAAPSDARRVYVTGYEIAGPPADGGTLPPPPHALRTDDAGAHWAELPLAGLTYGPTPIVVVLAVDPHDRDVVYLVSRGANPPTGDRLYRSPDGGATFTGVVATAAPVHDVVVRDAQTVLVATQNETGLGGTAYVSTDAGRSFTPMRNAPHLACLGTAPDGSLYGCAANWDPDYMAVTRSLDGGTTFRKVSAVRRARRPARVPRRHRRARHLRSRAMVERPGAARGDRPDLRRPGHRRGAASQPATSFARVLRRQRCAGRAGGKLPRCPVARPAPRCTRRERATMT